MLCTNEWLRCSRAPAFMVLGTNVGLRQPGDCLGTGLVPCGYRSIPSHPISLDPEQQRGVHSWKRSTSSVRRHVLSESQSHSATLVLPAGVLGVT